MRHPLSSVARRENVALVYAAVCVLWLVGCGQSETVRTPEEAWRAASAGQASRAVGPTPAQAAAVALEVDQKPPKEGIGAKPADVPVEGEWGDLIGQFVFDGDPPAAKPLNVPGEIQPKVPLVDETLIVDPKTKGIANIVIYVRTPKIAVHPQYEAQAKQELKCDNRDFRFVPRILPLRLSQTLVFTNNDVAAHNANYAPIGDRQDNPLIPIGARSSVYQASREQLIPQPVGCSIHGWMRGYILPRANPYVAVTGADGRFRLENLPAGELTFKVWHERCGWLEAGMGWTKGEFKQTIRAQPEPLDLGTIKVAAEKLKL